MWNTVSFISYGDSRYTMSATWKTMDSNRLFMPKYTTYLRWNQTTGSVIESVSTHILSLTHTHTHTYIYIYIYSVMAFISFWCLYQITLRINIVELSIPYEIGWSKGTNIKPAKMKILIKKKTLKGSVCVIVKAVEMGARGLVAVTQNQFLGQIGIKGCNRIKCIGTLVEITENSSIWIWNKRNISWNNLK